MKYMILLAKNKIKYKKIIILLTSTENTEKQKNHTHFGNVMHMKRAIYHQACFLIGKSDVYRSIRCEFLINLSRGFCLIVGR